MASKFGLLAAVWLPVASCVTPTASLGILSGSGSSDAAPAAFGAALPTSADTALRLTLRWPGGLADGCAPDVGNWASVDGVARDGFGVLAARSPNCTFADRAAAAAAAGVRALVVYNTVEGIYRNRSAAEDKYDYDCGNGRGTTSAAAKSYDADRLDGFLDSSCAASSACASRRCLATGAVDGDAAEICCAWDTYMTMAGDAAASVADGVSAVFISMRDADGLRANGALATPAPNAVTATLWDDSADAFVSWSAIAIWALGVATCAYLCRCRR